MKGFVAVFAVALLTGCAQTYQHHVTTGDSGMSGNHARVRVPNLVEILSVDGERMQTRSLLPMRESHVLLLEPGKHRVTARPRAAMDLQDEEHGVTMADATTLQFEVEPDSIYRIVFDPSGIGPDDGREHLWIEALEDE